MARSLRLVMEGVRDMSTTAEIVTNATTCLDIVNTVINIIGMILIPMAIIYITKRVQAKEQNHNDKMNLFKVLMTYRNLGWSVEMVHALNMIDIVFSDDPNVRAAWKTYYEALCIQNPTKEEQNQISNAQYDLLNQMATALGYKEDILWDAVQKPYLPNGMLNSMAQQQQYQDGISQLVGYAINQMHMAQNNQPNAPQSANETGRNEHADA